MFKKIVLKINKIEELAVIFFMGMMTAVAFLQVIGRYTDFPFSSWFEEILKYSFVWMVMLGGAIALRKGTHMGVNFITNLLSQSKQVFVNLWCDLISLVVSLSLFVVSFNLVAKLKKVNMTSASMDFPMWIIISALPLGFALMTLYSAIRVYQDTTGLLKIEEGGE